MRRTLTQGLRFLTLCALVSNLIGCGGGGGSSPSTTPSVVPPSNTSTSVKGFISKGPVDKATCKLLDASNREVSAPVTSVKGQIDFGNINVTGLLSIECSGGTYTDEATGNTTSLSTPLRSSFTVTAGAPATVSITPLSHIAYLRAGGDITQMAEQAQIVARALGLDGIDLLSTQPTDVNTTQAGNDAAGKYGVMLATISQYLEDQDVNLNSALTRLASSIDNQGLTGTARTQLQQALDHLIPDLGNSGNNSNNGAASHISETLRSAIKNNLKTGFGLTPDCQGANCGAVSATQYSGGIGVWRFDNTSDTAIFRDINISNVIGKTVTLLFSNGTASNVPGGLDFGVFANQITPPQPSVISSSTPDTEATRRDAAHRQHLHANTQALQQMAALNLHTANRPSTPLVLGATITHHQLGDTKIWNDLEHQISTPYATTAKVVCPAGNLGRRVIIWVQTNQYVAGTGTQLVRGQINDEILNSYKTSFCGSNHNNGQYAKIASVLGDVWGAHSNPNYIPETPTDKQDINIVAIYAENSDWGGYFYSFNQVLPNISGFSASNQALVFFVNTKYPVNNINDTLGHELTHMINFYQRSFLQLVSHDTWLEETSAVMTEDIFSLGALTSEGCITMVCLIKAYPLSGGRFSYMDWNSSNLGSTNYALARGFSAYLNRRFGPGIYQSISSECNTNATSTASTPSTFRSSGFTCLEYAIQKYGGYSFSEEFARFGASIFGKIGGTGAPEKYGFPAKNGTLTQTGRMTAPFSYSFPAIDNWWGTQNFVGAISPPALFPNTSHIHQSHVMNTSNYVKNNVSIPAKTSLIVIVK